MPKSEPTVPVLSGGFPALKNSEDVFILFRDKFGVDGDGDMDAIGLFAFSLVEKEHFEWRRHCREVHGVEPTREQIEDWFRNKPKEYFDQTEKLAFQWFYGFARVLLRQDIEEEKKQAAASAVGELGNFWTDFWRGNLVGMTSNIAFSLLIVLFVLFIASDFSFVAFTKKLIGAAH
jgi:hypothetical protein